MTLFINFLHSFHSFTIFSFKKEEGSTSLEGSDHLLGMALRAYDPKEGQGDLHLPHSRNLPSIFL